MDRSLSLRRRKLPTTDASRGYHGQMDSPLRSTLPFWLSAMPGHEAPPELTVADFLPRKFDSYCRVFNPAVSGAGMRKTWSEAVSGAATLSGRTQWNDLTDLLAETSFPRLDPAMGSLDRGVADVLISILGRHTRNTERVYYLVWEGYAGITSYSASETVDASYGRKMHYLQGSLEDASSTEAAGFNGAPLWWVPEDGSWCMGNDIYARSVYVGGSGTCIQEIIDDPRVESYPVAPTHKVSAEDR